MTEQMTSYQRRKQNIEFYKQRGQQLEEIIADLVDQVRSLGSEPRLLLGGGVFGDGFLNDINSGDFCMRMLSRPTPNTTLMQIFCIPETTGN